jgi:hypothetical protein
MGYVIVQFPDSREVFMDDESQGDNRDESGQYRILLVGDGWHTFRLGGAADYTPVDVTVAVAGSTAVSPFTIVFYKSA